MALFCCLQMAICSSTLAQTLTFTNTVNQLVEIKVLKSTDAPHSDKVHVYLLQVINTSNQAQLISLVAQNINCNNPSSIKDLALNHKVYTNNIDEFNATDVVKILLPANGEQNFHVKLMNESDVVNRYNCTVIKAIEIKNNKTISNELQIESFIPDPALFR